MYLHMNEINHPRKDETGCYMIQSLVRRSRIGRDGTDGNLLKAQSSRKNRSRRKLRTEITVDFTGSDVNNPNTVFHLEKSVEKEANVLRYSVNDTNYYLAANKSGKVKLHKLAHFPKNNSYLFDIEKIDHGIQCLVTFKSLKTAKYLHCNEKGKAFMKKSATKGDGEPQDRQTWFSLLSCKHTQVIKHEENMVFAANGDCVEITKEEISVRDDLEDGHSEDSGRGDSEILDPEDKFFEHSELILYVTAV